MSKHYKALIVVVSVLALLVGCTSEREFTERERCIEANIKELSILPEYRSLDCENYAAGSSVEVGDENFKEAYTQCIGMKEALEQEIMEAMTKREAENICNEQGIY